MLRADIPTIDDEEGECVPNGSGLVIDAHVHVQCFRPWF
jgi:hypothetical protein